jgi:LuxR family maltose regulon positive regulatory protein
MVNAAIEALAGALAADGRPLVVVLEDLESITDRRCLTSIDHAIAFLPGHVQLVVISRGMPPLRLARLRAEGELAEIGADVLAFTVPEAQEMFAAVESVSADAATVATLTARTEGWAAVLYLAALWLRDRRDPATALRTFRNSRHLSEYLAGEVLGGVDPDMERFVRLTAVLPQMNGPLCDAVLLETGSQERLLRLEQANLLVVPVVERRGWYRYHALLRDHMLGRVAADETGRLRRRALA